MKKKKEKENAWIQGYRFGWFIFSLYFNSYDLVKSVLIRVTLVLFIMDCVGLGEKWKKYASLNLLCCFSSCSIGCRELLRHSADVVWSMTYYVF